jgi:hypothetical protein
MATVWSVFGGEIRIEPGRVEAKPLRADWIAQRQDTGSQLENIARQRLVGRTRVAMKTSSQSLLEGRRLRAFIFAMQPPEKLESERNEISSSSPKTTANAYNLSDSELKETHRLLDLGATPNVGVPASKRP